MNELFDKISGDIKTAMLARDKVALETLRGIKKEFIEANAIAYGVSYATEQEIDKLKATNKMLTQKLEKSKKHVKDVDEIRTLLEEERNENVSLMEELKRMEDEYENLRSDFNKTHDDKNESVKEIDKLKEENKTLQESYKKTAIFL